MLIKLAQNRSIISGKICPEHSHEIGHFLLIVFQQIPQKSAKFPRNQPIFLWICSENPKKFGFFPWPIRSLGYMFLWTWWCTTFNNIPIILVLLTNKNNALIYLVTICEQKTTNDNCVWREGAPNINSSIGTIVFIFGVKSFHHHSLLLHMIKLSTG